VSTARLHRLVATHFIGWCFAGVLLSALQPFLFTHFRQDGWEDEPGFRVRNVSAMAQFDPDERVNHRLELETTLYVPASAHLDTPHSFENGLDFLMALVSLLLPLTVSLIGLLPPPERVSCERVPYTSGAPPPTALWRTQPPPTAPPLTP
jgi:hypothetical protein